MLARTLRHQSKGFHGIAARGFATTIATKQVKLPDLPYDYGALEPAISGKIMELHYTKHHQTYVTNYNATLEKYQSALDSNDVRAQIALQPAVRFNGGGHINHSLFWKNLVPKKDFEEPSGGLKKAIDGKYGSLNKFQESFNGALAGIQGSGWGWLVKKGGELAIVTTPNQDPVTDGTVLLGVDAWEHAYYLQYQNVKADYFKAIWTVMNWREAEKRYGS